MAEMEMIVFLVGKAAPKLSRAGAEQLVVKLRGIVSLYDAPVESAKTAAAIIEDAIEKGMPVQLEENEMIVVLGVFEHAGTPPFGGDELKRALERTVYGHDDDEG
jgi:hypothetical protein